MTAPYADLIERLTLYEHREGYDGKDWEKIASEAAKAIEALQAEVERLRGAIGWLEAPFIDANTPRNELDARIKFMLADAARAALITTSTKGVQMSDMVLVPRIASDAMMDAMFDTARQRERHMDGGVGYVQLRAAWEAALSAAPPASVGWQPIETAPRDGTPILAGSVHHRAREVVCWQDGIDSGSMESIENPDEPCEGWVNDGPHKDRLFANPRYFTHWMPLSTPPEGEG